MNSHLVLTALLVCLFPGCSDEEEDQKSRAKEQRRLMDVMRKQDGDPKSIMAAARGGDAAAQEDLGMMYSEGRGIAKNQEEAVTWFRKAAEQGAPNAQYRIGLCYYRGIGVTQDLVQAHGWLTMSAGNGCLAARKILPTIGGEMTPEQKTEAAQRANIIFDKHNDMSKKTVELVK